MKRLMDVREKLVELLRNSPHLDTIKGYKGNDCTFEQGADWLIANGVTVQEWISVDDELPKEQGYYRVYHKNSKSISDRFYYKDCTDLFVNVMDDPITYWKPIEQPPKGE